MTAMGGATERQVQRAIPQLGEAELRRFFAKIDSGKPADCWLWRAPASTGRYGLFRLHGEKYLPHRIMYSVALGAFDPSLCVCHRCDNPRCVNPHHLFLGTHAENMVDMRNKGRAARVGARGELSGRSKLTPEQVLEIRADNRMQRQIAAAYGIDQSSVSLIKRRINWAHL